MTPNEFVAKWRQTQLTERASAQSHFIDLCHLLRLPTPTDEDPAGTWYTFEKGATKASGGQGWADVWRRERFAWEYKAPGRSLERALQQLQLYRDALENPPLLVVSDVLQIQVHTNFTNTVKRVEEFGLYDLLKPARLDMLRAVWTEPDSFRVGCPTVNALSEEAARTFAHLADILRGRGAEPGRAAHFLIRLLFCLFAEDCGLLPANVFTRLVEITKLNSAEFTDRLRTLFATMSTGGYFGVERIPQFNGGLFDNEEALDVGMDGMEALRHVCGLDWSAVEPSILGTLFERSLDPSKRAQLGAHYTSRDDIQLIVEPVLMAPLRRRWLEVRSQARQLADRRDAASGGQRSKLHNELRSLLLGFAAEVASVRVLDPACGSGNFLYVSLRQLLDLEKQVVTEAADLDVGAFFPSVEPSQLHGIEINEYAHELAQATIWIGYIQWLRENGFGTPQEPILKRIETVSQMDAILTYDADGRPVKPEWPEADIIVGNPPFLGGKMLRANLGDRYIDDLFRVYDGAVPREADLVCYWHERARAQVEAGRIRRAGLLATNSIRGGANRRVLHGIKESGDIFMAWSDRPWVLDGAAVRVSMVGFDDGSEHVRTLDGREVASINADLTAATDLTAAARLPENGGIAFMGDTKGGAFDVDAVVAARLLAAVGNPNGRSNDYVVVPWANGLDVTRRPRGMWIIDFGTDTPAEQACLYEEPFQHVVQHVKPQRARNRREAYRERWWLHVESRPAMRAALASLTRYVATPRVAKHRLFTWLHASTLPDCQLIVIARDDDYFFGVLHSRPHEIWSLRMCSWLGVGNDPRYTPTTTFETFPFPWPPGREPASDSRVIAIADAARELVEKRDRWLKPEGATETELRKRTLTNLYNARPTWLDLAQRRLDEAVFDAYGWPHDLSDEEILERLLALNMERAHAIP